jgi:hypothetical protein
VQAECSVKPRRIGIKQKLARIEAMPLPWRERSMRAQAVARAFGYAWNEIMKNVAGAAGQLETPELSAVRVKRAKFDGIGVPGKHCDIDAIIALGYTKRRHNGRQTKA